MINGRYIVNIIYRIVFNKIKGKNTWNIPGTKLINIVNTDKWGNYLYFYGIK